LKSAFFYSKYSDRIEAPIILNNIIKLRSKLNSLLSN